MKNALLLIMIFTWLEAGAQLRVNLSLASPPLFEVVDIGRTGYFKSEKSSLSPGIELDNLFPLESSIAKLHYSIGFYYSTPTFIGAYQDPNKNEFFSEIKTQVINMPVMARASIPISDLIENNRLCMELGLMTTTWLNYKLQEVASIKNTDINGTIISETLYNDAGSLINGAGSKYNFKLVGGLSVYVNRFYLGARFDILSLSNLYSSRLESTWKVPTAYSLYHSAGTDGKMKNSYLSIILSFRITRK
jgi:hypothetical protein